MQKENEKNSFFKQLVKSIKDLDKYEDFAIQNFSNTFKYFIKMMLVFCLIASVFYSYKIIVSIKDIYADLKDKVPEFEYSQGIIETENESPIIIDDYKEIFGEIIIDSKNIDVKKEQYEKNINESKSAIVFLKDKFVMFSNGAMGQVTYKYSDIANQYGVDKFTKQSLIEYIDGINMISVYIMIYVIVYIYVFILYFISTGIDVLILTLLSLIVSRISRIKLKIMPSFNIAIHSITLPLILNLIYITVNLLTGFYIKYFGLMYSTISYIYVIVAVLMIKTDFINRQLELIQLEKEKEKVKKEIKEQEEKDKQEQEQEKKKKENEDKNNVPKHKNKKNGEEPVGDASIIPEKK